MKAVREIVIKNKTAEKNPPLHIEVADSFLKRLQGLMGCKKMPENNGLLLIPCNSIHMLFMRFAIDVIYLDKNNKIIKLVKNLKPWIGMSFCPKAYSVLEVVNGTIDRYGYSVGDEVMLY